MGRPWDKYLDPDEGNPFRPLEAWEKWIREQPDLDGELGEILDIMEGSICAQIALYGIMDDLCDWKEAE